MLIIRIRKYYHNPTNRATGTVGGIANGSAAPSAVRLTFGAGATVGGASRPVRHRVHGRAIELCDETAATGTNPRPEWSPGFVRWRHRPNRQVKSDCTRRVPEAGRPASPVDGQPVRSLRFPIVTDSVQMRKTRRVT